MPKEKPEQFFDKTSDINELASSLPKLIQASARLQAHVFNSCMKCNIEMLDFLKHRFEQDMKLVEEVTCCQDSDKVVKTCMDFWECAVSEYSSEAGKLAAMNSQAAGQIEKVARTLGQDIAAAGNA